MPLQPIRAELVAESSSDKLQVTTENAKTAIPSIKTLLTLIFTSSAFRLLLSSLLTSARQVLATASHVAGEVQTHAEQVELGARSLKIGVDDMRGATEAVGVGQAVGNAVGGVKEVLDGVGHVLEVQERHEAPDDENQCAFVTRIHEVGVLLSIKSTHMDTIIFSPKILLEAHQDPSFLQALQNLVSLFKQYATFVSGTIAHPSENLVTFEVDDSLKTVLAHLRTILERLSTGRSFNLILDRFSQVQLGVANSPTDSGVKSYLADLSSWLDNALLSADYVRSSRSTQTLSSLYTRAQKLLSSPSQSQLSKDLRSLFDELNDYLIAIETNPVLVRLKNAFSSTTQSFAQLTRDVTKSRKWREEVVEDMMAWLLPKVAKALGPIPMPRVEYANTRTGIEVAIESTLVTLGGLEEWRPDVVSIRNWSELRIDMGQASSSSISSASDQTRIVTSQTHVQIHVEGIRASAQEVGYFVNYAGWYSDEGFVSVDFGRGIGIDVDVEIESDWDGVEETKVECKVRDVRVVISSLNLKFKDSKHWILNWFVVQPVAKTIGRWVVEKSVTSSVENVVRKFREVHEVARRGGGNGEKMRDVQLSEWIRSVVEVFGRKDEAEVERLETGKTKVGVKGITHTTTKYQHEGGREGAEAPMEESLLAVGIGPQVLQGGPDVARTAPDQS
jgi:hypothetical protein